MAVPFFRPEEDESPPQQQQQQQQQQTQPQQQQQQQQQQPPVQQVHHVQHVPVVQQHPQHNDVQHQPLVATPQSPQYQPQPQQHFQQGYQQQHYHHQLQHAIPQHTYVGMQTPAHSLQQQQQFQQQQPQPQQQQAYPQPISATSATQTPLLSPANGDHLLKVIYDAINMLASNSVAGTPVYTSSPPSSPMCAGCSGSGNVFFARSNPMHSPHTPHTPRLPGGDQSSTGHRVGPHPRHPHPRTIGLNHRRSRLNSTGSTDEYFDDEYVASELESNVSASSSFSSPSAYVHEMNMANTGYGAAVNHSQSFMLQHQPYQQQQQHPYQQHYDYDQHFNYTMDAREYLPEFPGQIPMRKKTAGAAAAQPQPTTSNTDTVADALASLKINETTDGSQTIMNHAELAIGGGGSGVGVDVELKATVKSNEPKFVWPTVVGAVVLAVGCGFLAARSP